MAIKGHTRRSDTLAVVHSSSLPVSLSLSLYRPPSTLPIESFRSEIENWYGIGKAKPTNWEIEKRKRKKTNKD